jgi:hypothetical protein
MEGRKSNPRGKAYIDILRMLASYSGSKVWVLIVKNYFELDCSPAVLVKYQELL